IKPTNLKGHTLCELKQRLERLGFGRTTKRLGNDLDVVWLQDVMQGVLSPTDIRDAVGDVSGLDQLVGMAQDRLRVRNRALAVLAQLKGISLRSTARFLRVGA